MARYIGIDVSEGAVRVALLRTALVGAPTVEALAEVSIAEAGGEAAALKLATASMRPDSVAIAAPGDQVLFRKVELPAAAVREVANVLPFELEATVPIDLADVVFDHRLAPREKGAATVTVHAALARSADVRGLAARVLAATGWSADLVAPAPLAFVPLLAFLTRGGPAPAVAPSAAPQAAPGPGPVPLPPPADGAVPLVEAPPVVQAPPLGAAEAPPAYGAPLAEDRPTPLHPFDPSSQLPRGPEPLELGADDLTEDRPTPSRPIPIDVLQRELDARGRPDAPTPPPWDPGAAAPWAFGPSTPDAGLPAAPHGAAGEGLGAPPAAAPLEAVAPPPPAASLVAQAPSTDLPAGPILFVDIAERRTDLVIVLAGEPVFVRTLSRGTAGLPASAAPLAREIRQSVSAHRLAGGDPPAAFVLLGPGSTVPGALAFLEEELGVPARALPPTKLKAPNPLIAEALAARLPRFAKAVGLALGLAGKAAFNLRTGALQAEQGYPFLREKFPVLFGLAAVVAMSFGFSYLARSKSLDADKEIALAKLAQTSLEVLGESTTDVERARELLEKGPAVEDDPLPRADAFDVMVQLAKAVPEDVVHDVLDFDVQRNHVTIQGAVPSVTDAQKIVDGLKEHRCLKESKGVRTSQFGPDRLKYTVELDLKCDDKKKAGAGAAASASAGVAPEAPRPKPSSAPPPRSSSPEPAPSAAAPRDPTRGPTRPPTELRPGKPTEGR